MDGPLMRAVQAALQRVTTIKPAKRRQTVTQPKSRGAILKEIEKGIANLDRWQKRAAIESPEGPQRIRGLAGSGKTVVLALKAAYLHAQHPEWRIVVTFYSRALYQQITDLVTRFSFEHRNDAPDFTKLRILHSWGSSSRDGVYSVIADALNAPVRDFRYASQAFGRGDPFRGVCTELLTAAEQTSNATPLFDAVLIDEAQDLPPEFFQLIYRFTAEPRRIVWAFDELQKLSEAAMPSTEELFGTTTDGESLVNLASHVGEASRDIVLPVCYRNSPWSLATAHALGFGIYRDGGLVQHFDDPQLWEEIGYSVVHGELALGSHVELERSQNSYPEYFPQLLSPNDSVHFEAFDVELAQDTWVSEQIVRNLKEDELEHDDILVVLPDAYTSKRRGARFARTLARFGVQCHLAGEGSSIDEIFKPDSIAMAHVFRAKGNEAPMVYVLDAQHVVASENVVTKRNTLFTSITRSRAWVRICAWGPAAGEVHAEVAAVQDSGYRLSFDIPTGARLETIRRVHRDRSRAEVASIRRATRGARELVEALERDEIDLEDLPPEVRTRLVELVRPDLDYDDE